MHIYEVEGHKLPSVTTIIHSLGDDNLMRWSNSLGFRHIKYDTEMERTSHFGTLAHSHMQAIVDKDNANPLEPRNGIEEFELSKLLTNFINCIFKYNYKTIFTEKTIASIELGYGGTIDWLCTIDKYICLIDFKTSKAPRFGMFLQLGGYYNLLKTIGYNNIDYAGILTANKDKAKLHPINRDTLEYFSKLFDLLAKYYIEANSKIDNIPIDYELDSILSTK
jgi:hypothetical protein